MSLQLTLFQVASKALSYIDSSLPPILIPERLLQPDKQWVEIELNTIKGFEPIKNTAK